MRKIYGQIQFHGEDGVEILVAVRYSGKYRLQFPSRGENAKPFFLNRGFGYCDWTAEELLKQWHMDVSKPLGYLETRSAAEVLCEDGPEPEPRYSYEPSDLERALEHEGRFPVE